MKTYKNISDQTLEVVGVGIVGPGATVEAELIVNSNFVEVRKEAKAKAGSVKTADEAK